MSAIQDLYQQVQLAEAAYANFFGMNVSTSNDLIEAALIEGDNKFSTTQAATFASEWQVVDHIPDTATGSQRRFSASVGWARSMCPRVA